jgi:hypothetical protein
VARSAKVLAWVVAVVGPPAAGVALWWHTVSVHRPWVAAVGAIAWEGVLGLGTLAARAVGPPTGRRLDQVGGALDLALGRRVSRYGACYQRYVLSWLRFMESKGLATPGESVPELDEVFIDVGLVPRAPGQVGTGVLADSPAEVGQRQSIWDFLDRPQPAVLAVIGAPGSGKTTLLRHVARRVAGPSRQRLRTLPILLELRSHSERLGDPATTLPQLIRGALPDLNVAEPPGWWEAQLRRGTCVVLLDGLDEVAGDQDRQAISAWIEAQIAAYPGNDFVITSRPHGYRTALIDPALVLQARPFSTDQAERFLQSWYRAAERRATGATGPDVEQRADPQARDLVERLHAAPALYDLMVNPLLLTMIANVHRYRAALPGSRAELYREMCQVMLYRRAEAKHLATAVPGPAKERLLRQLAYTMMREQVAELPRERVLAELRPGLRRVPGAPDPRDFLDEVGNNGLLIEQEKGRYAFAHLTFQEYLAAAHIQDRGLARVLLNVVDQPWWRETTLLYTANADADPIVQACLEAGTIAAFSLAYECAETAELAPELRMSLEVTMDAAFAPDAEPERRRLVAGVLATRHLSRLLPTPTRTLICPRPVPADLYQLFLRDTGLFSPDGHCFTSLRRSAPTTGIWAPEALAFVHWINSLIPNESGGEYRLPTPEELNHLAATTRASAPVSAWAAPESRNLLPQLWTAPGRRASPHQVTGAHLLKAVTADVTNSPVLLQMTLLTVHVEVELIRSSLDLANPRASDLTRAGHHAKMLARDVDRALALARGVDIDLDRDVARAGALAFKLEYYRNIVFDLTRDLARIVAHDRKLDLTRDLDITRDLGLDLDVDLDHARALAADLAVHRVRASDLALDRTGGLMRGHDRTSDLKSGMTYLIGAAFADALSQTQDKVLDNAAIFDRFALALLRSAVIDASHVFHPPPDSLAGTARLACSAVMRSADAASWAYAAADRFRKNADSVFGRRNPVTPATATSIRLAALALAHASNEISNHPGPADAFRLLAAGITLLQERASLPDELESLVLART